MASPAAAHSLPEAYLTRSAVAGLLGVSPTTVTRWAREGRLPCRRTLGGHHRFDLAVIEEVRERMRQGPHDAAGALLAAAPRRWGRD